MAATKPKRESINWDDQKNYPEAEGTNKVRLRPSGENWSILGEPLYRTVDGRLVHENNPDGRWLYGNRGARVPNHELVAGGLLVGEDEDAEGKHAKKDK